MKRRPAVRERCRGEGGFTLTEALVALIILGVSVFAVITAMGASIRASDVHRKTVTSDAALRSYAERLNVAVYQECASAAVPQYQPVATGVTVPANYTLSITSVKYWDGTGDSSTPAGFNNNCQLITAPWDPSKQVDWGVQQITIQARSNDGRAVQSVTILKRRL